MKKPITVINAIPIRKFTYDIAEKLSGESLTNALIISSGAPDSGYFAATSQTQRLTPTKPITNLEMFNI